MSISNEDFTKAVGILHGKWQGLGQGTEWKDMKLLKQYGVTYLRITRQLEVMSSRNEEAQEQELLDEDDEEALSPCSKATSTRLPAVYDVTHSPSYQVPTLYLTLPSTSQRSPEQVYDLLVPDSYKSAMQAIGVMGALSMTEHPVTGMPAWFVHPCRTREAMDPLLEGRHVEPEEYLMLWLGMIGGSVGLNLPVELAQQISATQHGG